MMGLFEALDGSSKNVSSCFIKMCICGDVHEGMNKIFIQMLLCNKSRVGAQTTLPGVTRRPGPAAGSLLCPKRVPGDGGPRCHPLGRPQPSLQKPPAPCGPGAIAAERGCSPFSSRRVSSAQGPSLCPASRQVTWDSLGTAERWHRTAEQCPCPTSLQAKPHP